MQKTDRFPSVYLHQTQGLVLQVNSLRHLSLISNVLKGKKIMTTLLQNDPNMHIHGVCGMQTQPFKHAYSERPFFGTKDDSNAHILRNLQHKRTLVCT